MRVKAKRLSYSTAVGRGRKKRPNRSCPATGSAMASSSTMPTARRTCRLTSAFLARSVRNNRAGSEMHRHGKRPPCHVDGEPAHRAHRVEERGAIRTPGASARFGLRVLLLVAADGLHGPQKVRRRRLCRPVLLTIEGKQQLSVLDDALQIGA